jgi:hypothetical protein
MSTIGKILKSSIFLGGINVAMAAICKDPQNDFKKNLFEITAAISLPSIALTIFDKYINQNITDSKVIQYGMTIGEGALIYDKMYNSDKTVTILAITQTLGLKYIWDQDDESGAELDQIPMDAE